MSVVRYTFFSQVLREQVNVMVVLPEVKNSFYSNMVHGKNYFDFISKELPTVMENVFPLTHDSKERFVIGNSMGSHGAIKWALNCPGFFAAAAGMSGAGDLEELGFYDGRKERVLNAFGTMEQYRGSMNDFKYMVDKHLEEGTKLPRLYFCCGKQDGFYEGAKLFAEYVREKGLETKWEEADGQHNWEYWDTWLPVMMKYLIKGDA